jgi:hypothetical protein
MCPTIYLWGIFLGKVYMKIICISLLIVLSAQAMELQELIIRYKSHIFYLSEDVRQELEKAYETVIPQFDPSLVCYKKIKPDPRGTILPLSFIFQNNPFTYDDIIKEIAMGSYKYKLADNPESEVSAIEDFKKVFEHFEKYGASRHSPKDHQQLLDNNIIGRFSIEQDGYLTSSHGVNSRVWIYDKALQEAGQLEKLKQEEQEKERARLEKLAPIALRLTTLITRQNLQNKVGQFLILARR